MQVLRSYLEHAAPHHPGRLQELFARIPEVNLAINFPIRVLLVKMDTIYDYLDDNNPWA